jgi:membrane associated rhomboid family serine protease
MNEDEDEKKEVRQAAVVSFVLAATPWIVHIAGAVFSLNLRQYGLQPLTQHGLTGILTMPLIHGDLEHLVSNTPALFLLIFGLFLFYKRTAWRIFAYLYLLSGLLTWFMGRDATHIGASGIVYAMAAFHFTSGMIKRIPRQRAFALLVSFLYGGFVWAFFPTLYQGTSISWEGHLSGLLTGIVLALYFRREGPEPPSYPNLEEDEEKEEDVEEGQSS